MDRPCEDCENVYYDSTKRLQMISEWGYSLETIMFVPPSEEVDDFLDRHPLEFAVVASAVGRAMAAEAEIVLNALRPRRCSHGKTRPELVPA